MIKAGDLREKIELSRLIQFPNGSGGGTFNQEPYLNTYAKVEEITSSPELMGQQEVTQNALRVTIRYRPDVDIVNGDLITWRGFNLVLNNFKVDTLRTKIEMLLSFESGTSERQQKDPGVNPGKFDNSFDNTFN